MNNKIKQLICKTATITIYGVKSTRKNAKCNYKEYNIFMKNNHNFKDVFTYSSIGDMKEYIQKNEYSKYQLSISIFDTDKKSITILHNCNTKTFYSKECIIKTLVQFIDLINAYSLSNIKTVAYNKLYNNLYPENIKTS